MGRERGGGGGGGEKKKEDHCPRIHDAQYIPLTVKCVASTVNHYCSFLQPFALDELWLAAGNHHNARRGKLVREKHMGRRLEREREYRNTPDWQHKTQKCQHMFKFPLSCVSLTI